MVIAHGVDKRLGICDIETLAGLFDVGVYNPDTKEWIEFEISPYRNQLFEFVKWYTSNSCDFLVTFNGIGFDQQVLQYIVDNHQKWIEKTNEEICLLIYQNAQTVIENGRYNIFPSYRESQFSIPPLDLFKIHHFDNDARKTSLKWCAFMLNMDVEEMPIHHTRTNLTEEEIKTVRAYRRNDIRVTEALLNLTLGVVDVPELADYKGKNKIQDRYDVEKETGMKCLNWNDVKIGEEWNKLNYMKMENIYDEKKLFPQKIEQPYGKKFKNFFPKTMCFTTDKLNNFIKDLGNKYVTGEKQEFPLVLGNTTYTLAKGGIHSTEKNRALKPPKGYILRDADVGGQYPWFIIKSLVIPPHLKNTIIKIAEENVNKRPVLKAKAKQLIKEGKPELARPLMGLQEMLKLCNNGGLYGKLGQKGSFLHYPAGLLKVCLGCEIEILMLIEMMQEVGFEVFSGNTDGIMVMFPKDKEQIYNDICTKWEQMVGNITSGKLEYADFDGLWQDNINSYIGKKTDGSVKKKGKFLTQFELNKNKSKRIIPLALEQYFINGINPIDFIPNHKNIFDFCIAKKATGKLHYEEQLKENYIVSKDMLESDGWTFGKFGWIYSYKDIWSEENEKEASTTYENAAGIYRRKYPRNVIVHKKLVRYFISTTGNVLWKRGINNKGGQMNNHCEAATKLGQPLVIYFNKAFESDNYNIDYDYYILEALERIDSIEKTRKADTFISSKMSSQQLTLF